MDQNHRFKPFHLQAGGLSSMSLFADISGVSSLFSTLVSMVFDFFSLPLLSSPSFSDIFRNELDEPFASDSDSVDGRGILFANGNGKFSTCGVWTATISVCVPELSFTSGFLSSDPMPAAKSVCGILHKTLIHWIMSRIDPCNCCTCCEWQKIVQNPEYPFLNQMFSLPDLLEPSRFLPNLERQPLNSVQVHSDWLLMLLQLR